jgi:selenocysteine lyase/cysteine desulfurase
MIGIHALDASLEMFEEVGMPTVEERLAANVAFLESALLELPGLEIVSPRDPARRAGILTFRHARIDGTRLHSALMRAQVICAARAGGVRLAPHFYTPQAVLETAVERIRQIIQDS